MTLNLSGTTSYQVPCGTIITRALNLLGVRSAFDTAQSSSTAMCLDFLNMMIKEMVQDGMHLWTQHEGALLFQNNVATYTFHDPDLVGGSAGIMNQAVLVTTTLASDAVTGASTLTVESNSGVSATDIIIITLDDETSYQTVVDSVAGDTTITITGTLPSDASSPKNVYIYPTAVNQTDLFNPRKLSNVRLRDIQGYERFLTPLSRGDYLGLSNKAITGTPTSYYLDDQLQNKQITFYPVPVNLQETLRFTYHRSLDDLEYLTEDVQFPQEHTMMLVWNFAVVIAPAFGVSSVLGDPRDPSSIAGKARIYLDRALSFDKEDVDIQFFIPRSW